MFQAPRNPMMSDYGTQHNRRFMPVIPQGIVYPFFRKCTSRKTGRESLCTGLNYQAVLSSRSAPLVFVWSGLPTGERAPFSGGELIDSKRKQALGRTYRILAGKEEFLMAQESKKQKEYVVNFRSSNNGSSYTHQSKTVKANSESAATSLVKGLASFVQVLNVKPR